MRSSEGSTASSTFFFPKIAIAWSRSGLTTGRSGSRTSYPRPLRLHEYAHAPLSKRASITGFVTAPVPEVHRDLRGRQPALAVCAYLTLTGSTVPSDHQPVGTMKLSIGSGEPLNCGCRMTGEWGRSAPQAEPSMSGV